MVCSNVLADDDISPTSFSFSNKQKTDGLLWRFNQRQYRPFPDIMWLIIVYCKNNFELLFYLTQGKIGSFLLLRFENKRFFEHLATISINIRIPGFCLFEFTFWMRFILLAEVIEKFTILNLITVLPYSIMNCPFVHFILPLLQLKYISKRCCHYHFASSITLQPMPSALPLRNFFKVLSYPKMRMPKDTSKVFVTLVLFSLKN